MFFFLILLLLVVVTEDNDSSLKDTARKLGLSGQTITPRHTIDAILGLKNRNDANDGKFIKSFISINQSNNHKHVLTFLALKLQLNYIKTMKIICQIT